MTGIVRDRVVIVTGAARGIGRGHALEFADPAFAARAGFDRPILHGLCTYGITGRALLHAVAGSDPARFAAMSGRFSGPVFPGEALTVSIWVEGDIALFRTAKSDGTVVIDRGRAVIRRAAGAD